MKLSYDISKIENWQTLFVRGRKSKEQGWVPDPQGDDDFLNADTEALVFAMVAVGMCDITEKNSRTVYERIAKFERATGAFRWGEGGKPNYFTHAFVSQHIGLKTNIPYVKEAAFIRTVYYAIRIPSVEDREVFLDTKPMINQY